MTSILLVKAPDRLVAVADGRLSVGASTVSFDTTPKILRFAPWYRIPYVSMGRHSHYVEYLGREVFVAYAGTYGLVSQILDVFRARISGQHILVWDNGAPTLAETFDENTQFLHDYIFGPEDQPDIGPRLLLEDLRAAVQDKADEWCRNRKAPADCEFLLFGKDEKNAYFAYRVSIDPAWSLGQPVRVRADPVADGDLVAIGEPAVSGAAVHDTQLMDGLQGWRVDQERLGVNAFFDDYARKEAGLAAPGAVPTPTHENWSPNEVVARLAHIIRTSGVPSVGGSLLVARGGWYGQIELRSIT